MAKSFADVGFEEALRSAHTLVPKLRELAPASEAARQLRAAGYPRTDRVVQQC